MLVLPLKVSHRYDIRAVLSNWLDSHDDHNENDTQHERSFHTLYSGGSPSAAPSLFVPPKPSYSSQQCAMELKRLQSVRNCITDGILQANSHALALEEQALRDCYEYHAILLEFEKRGFPVTESTSSSSDKNTLSITWKGAYSPVQKETHSTLVWERVCIIFNIVALLTYQVEHHCNTTDRDSCKTAVGYCQQGASLLSILRELCSSIASTSSSQNAFMTVDLSPSMLLFWEKLLIAEAQCYIYRMASLAPEDASDRESIGRQHRTLAVLCQAAFDLWNDALAASQDPRLASELPKQVTLWGSYLKASSLLYIGRAMYHQSVAYRVQDEHGLEIAQLRECQEKLQACAEFTQSIVGSGSHQNEDGVLSAASAMDYTARECQAILPVVRDRFGAADRTNLQLYHHVIPKSVPNIPAKQLAKLNPELPSPMVVPQIPLFTDM
jgi:BRO1-like domain